MKDTEYVSARVIAAAVRFIASLRSGVRVEQVAAQKELEASVEAYTRPTTRLLVESPPTSDYQILTPRKP